LPLPLLFRRRRETWGFNPTNKTHNTRGIQQQYNSVQPEPNTLIPVKESR
jgi:hypothetical protein